MHCPKCHTDIVQIAKYCPECGISLKELADDKSSDSTAIPTETILPMPEDVPGFSTKGILLIIAVILLVFAIPAAYDWFCNSSTYKQAQRAIVSHHWDVAISKLNALPNGYLDKDSKLAYAKNEQWQANRPQFYQRGIEELHLQLWDDAIDTFTALGQYRDAPQIIAYAHAMKVESARKQLIAEQRKKDLERLALVDGNRITYQRMLRLLNAHPDWSEEHCALIAQRRIQRGMSREQAIAAWGKPEDINKDVGEWGVHEQWCYANSYLYFENGELTSWQN